MSVMAHGPNTLALTFCWCPATCLLSAKNVERSFLAFLVGLTLKHIPVKLVKSMHARAHPCTHTHAQVNWTKWSAPGTGTGARRPDNRRETDDTRVKIRPSRAGGTLQLYFCSADGDGDGAEKQPGRAAAPSVSQEGDGDRDGGGSGDAKAGAATLYADIASILQVNTGGLDRRWWWGSGEAGCPWLLFGGADAAAAAASAAMAAFRCLREGDLRVVLSLSIKPAGYVGYE